MTQRMNRNNTKVVSCLFLILILMSTTHFADEPLTPRIQIGLNLIPAVLAANKHINTEHHLETLTLHIVYRHNKQLAIDSARQLESVRDIRGRKLLIEVINFNDLMGHNIRQYDALFICEILGQDLDVMIRYARKKKVILFSPFKGDVKKGVMAGFEVTNKVLPAINLKAMKNSNVDLKAFFLRIAVKYEQ